MFLKQKRCGKIKGRDVTYEQKIIIGSKKWDVTSPTAATESVFVTAAIYAIEIWYISVIDTPEAFLTADIFLEK